MAATVIINRYTGAGAGSKTAITSGNTRLSSSDAATPGTSDPIVIPAAGTNYSYWCSTRLECTVAPTGTIDNLRWHPVTPNPWGTGISGKGQEASTGANAGYRQATGTQGTTGDVLNTTNHTGLDATPTDIWGFTEGSPLAVTGSTTTAVVFGSFVVFQVEVASTASAGTLSQVTARWRYDET